MRYDAMRRWDQLLDWWEFTAARYLARHRRALTALVCVLAALSAIMSTWAYAQPQPQPETEAFVIVRRALLNDAIEMIERLRAENEALRLRCPVGAVGV